MDQKNTQKDLFRKHSRPRHILNENQLSSFPEI